MHAEEREGKIPSPSPDDTARRIPRFRTNRIEYTPQNWYLEMARRRKIDLKLKYATAYKKALHLKWVIEVTDPEQQVRMNTHFGHLASTAYQSYCFSNMAKNLVSCDCLQYSCQWMLQEGFTGLADPTGKQLLTREERKTAVSQEKHFQ